MKQLRSTFAAAAATIALSLATAPASLAQSKDLTIVHAKGETVLRQVPRKVAVFDLATLDILNALKVDAVAGVPKGTGSKGILPPSIAHYSDAKYANVGTLFEPDLPALSALKPDLIVVGGRSARKYDAVRTIAPTVDMTPVGNDLAASTVANTRKLGEVFGVSDRAEKRIAAFETQMAALHAQAAKAGTGLMLFAVGQGVTVQAPGDRFGTAYGFVGIRSAIGPSVPEQAGPRPAAGSPEADAAAKRRAAALKAALATDPTWLLVLDRAAATGSSPTPIAQRLAANSGVAASSAWKAGRVIYLDPKTWYLVGAGIDGLSRSAAETLATLRSQP